MDPHMDVTESCTSNIEISALTTFPLNINTNININMNMNININHILYYNIYRGNSFYIIFQAQ